MGILKKSVLGISIMLIVIFSIVTIGINLRIAQNNNFLVSSILDELDKDTEETLNSLSSNFKGIATELDSADSAIEQIIINLYTTSYNTLVRAIANQIFPMIESFNFDSAGEIIATVIKTNEAVKWVKLVTSEEPTSADIYEFGDKSSEESKNFTHQIRGEFSFLEIEMQVSLSSMEAISDVKNIFSVINTINQELAASIESTSHKTHDKVENFSTTLSQKNKNSFIKQSLFFMFFVLVLVCLCVVFFIKKWITGPITESTSGLSAGASQMAAASLEISSSSLTLAEGSSQQAASIEEVSSSLDEMASMTKQNAENADQANVLIGKASEAVFQANDFMDDLNTSMKETSKASEETSKIIKTIDEIAFQTNLLALNAAVEAARAGEAGAGFAVVADEVRNLALRATNAAKDTERLIFETVKRIENGEDLVQKTNQAFFKVEEASTQVNELVGEIAAASNEQALGINQINQAVAEMDKVVQHNAASAEEFASSSEEMHAQAEQMKSYVDNLVELVGGSKVETDAENKASAKGTSKTLAIATEKKKAKELETRKDIKVGPEQLIPLEDDDFKDFS